MGRALVLVAVLACALLAAPAGADDPPFVNWPALLPSLAPGFSESTFALCRDGSPACLPRTLAEMDRRLAGMDAACDHNALFLRNYRLITQTYGALPPGFLEDERYFAHEDAVFAQLYFDAEDAWRAGRAEAVPEAWRLAFDAARDRRAQGAGNLLLGINAHVQRDMPFMLAGLGLTKPDGGTRKTDHDRFNAVLNASYDDVLQQAIEQDDPDLAMYDVPATTADGFLAFQTIASWREGAWRNAERLLRATTDAERAFIAQQIEEQAATTARAILATFPYGGTFTTARRDALCEARKRAARAGAAPARRPGTTRAECRAGLRFLRVRGGALRVSVKPRGCARRTEIALARLTTSGQCRFLGRRGLLGRPRSCGRPVWRRTGPTIRPRPGRWLVRARAIARDGAAGPRTRLRAVRIGS